MPPTPDKKLSALVVKNQEPAKPLGALRAMWRAAPGQLTHHAAAHPGGTAQAMLGLSFLAGVFHLFEGYFLANALCWVVAVQATAFLLEYAGRLAPVDFNVSAGVSPVLAKELYHPSTGELVAEVKHHGRGPILALYSDDPYLQGLAAAQATPEQNQRAFIEFYHVAQNLIEVLHGAQCLARLKMPMWGKARSDYIAGQRAVAPHSEKAITEMDGFVAGYNRNLADDPDPYYFPPKPLTEAQLADMKRIPDSFPMRGTNLPIGCSVAVRKNGDGSVEVGRNWDFEVADIDRYACIKVLRPTGHRSDDKPQFTLSFTVVPGFVRVSLINDKGLSVYVNEAGTKESARHSEHPNRLPKLELAQAVADNCCTLEESIAFIRQNPAASTHMLIIVDANGDAACIQLLPPGCQDDFTVVRPNEKGILAVANHMVDEHGKNVLHSESWETTDDRYKQMMKDLEAGLPMNTVMQHVNVPQTVDRVVTKMKPLPRQAANGDAAVNAPMLSTNGMQLHHLYGGRNAKNRTSENFEPREIFATAMKRRNNLPTIERPSRKPL